MLNKNLVETVERLREQERLRLQNEFKERIEYKVRAFIEDALDTKRATEDWDRQFQRSSARKTEWDQLAFHQQKVTMQVMRDQDKLIALILTDDTTRKVIKETDAVVIHRENLRRATTKKKAPWNGKPGK